MDRLRVFQAGAFPPPVQALFSAEFDITLAATEDPAAEIEQLGEKFDALICLISHDLRNDAPRRLARAVDAIATYSVGLDHIDLASARDNRIAVFNTPGVLDDAVADAAMFLVLGAARRGNEAFRLIHQRRWKGWQPQQLIGLGLAGRRIGILGMGGVGSKIAIRAQGFGMEVSYCARSPSVRAPSGAVFIADPEELIRTTDIFVLACPSTPQTRRFLNAERLRHVCPELIVVNIGRGDLVDDDALVAALAEGRIFAAGLDVFNNEPNLDARYYDLPNAFITPHIGSSTIEARLAMGQALVDGLQAWRRGEAAANRVV